MSEGDLREFFGRDREVVGDAIPAMCPECGWGTPTSDGYCLNCAPPDDDEFYDDDLECTHRGGEGLCSDGADPLGNCPEDFHRCHACGGSGNRRDQTIW